MKPVADIRRIRLQQLCESEGGQAQLARRVHRDRRQISAWLAAPAKPGAKNMSAATARWLEQQCGKPIGWLEHDGNPHSEIANPLRMRAAVGLLRELASLNLAPSQMAHDPDAIAIAYNFIVRGHASDT